MSLAQKKFCVIESVKTLKKNLKILSKHFCTQAGQYTPTAQQPEMFLILLSVTNDQLILVLLSSTVSNYVAASCGLVGNTITETMAVNLLFHSKVSEALNHF